MTKKKEKNICGQRFDTLNIQLKLTTTKKKKKNLQTET
jgi:hypothetical protein